MRYIIIVIVMAVFTGTCFGITSGTGSWTNLLSGSTNLARTVKAAKVTEAATNQPPKWDGTFTLGVTATAGNVNSVLSTAKVVAQKNARWNQYNLEADGAYGTVDDVQSAQSAHGSAQANHIFIDDKWYGYGRGDALHDAIANVDYRLTGSAGGGYYFIKDKITTFSSELGPALQYERLDDEYHTYPSVRLAQNYERKIDDHARVWENVEFIPPVTYPDAFLVNATVGVETPLTHSLSLQTYVQDNFANAPAPGFKNNDLKLISGVVFKF
jgi:putative salt-induced outer membrane protein YdiY